MDIKNKDYKLSTLKDIYDSKLDLDSKEKINQHNSFHFYAVILTASFPNKYQQNQFQVNLTVTDHSQSSDNEWSYVFFISDEINNMPIITKIGQIVRVHRGSKKYHRNGKLQLTLNLNKSNKIKSSWVIFPVESNDYEPISYSSDKYSMMEKDKKTIDHLREWSKTFFSNRSSLLTEYLANLSDLNCKYCQNVVIRVIEKKVVESKISLLIEDYTTKSVLDVDSQSDGNDLKYLKSGDIILIKAIKKWNQKLIVNEYSHFLFIPEYCFLYKDFLRKFKDKKDLENIEEELNFNSVELDMRKDHINSQNKNEMKIEKHTYLNDSRFNFPKKYVVKTNEMENVDLPFQTYEDIISYDFKTFKRNFITEFSVLCVFPDDVKEYVQVYCEKCLNIFSIKDYSKGEDFKGFYCLKNCINSNCKLIYYIRLICRFEYIKIRSYEFVLLSMDDEGISFFKGNLPDDLYKNEELLLKLKKIKEELTTCFNFVKVKVESIPVGEQICFRIVGQYN